MVVIIVGKKPKLSEAKQKEISAIKSAAAKSKRPRKPNKRRSRRLP